MPKPPPTSGARTVDAVGRQLEDELGELAADAVHALPGQLAGRSVSVAAS